MISIYSLIKARTITMCEVCGWVWLTIVAECEEKGGSVSCVVLEGVVYSRARNCR